MGMHSEQRRHDYSRLTDAIQRTKSRAQPKDAVDASGPGRSSLQVVQNFEGGFQLRASLDELVLDVELYEARCVELWEMNVIEFDSGTRARPKKVQGRFS